MLKVLVTGANGYIGQHVVNEAVRQGFDVVTVDLKNQKKTEETCHIELNILENASLPNLYEILGKPDVIIHLAWQNGFNHNADSHLISLPSHYAFLKNMIDAGCPSVSIMGSMHEIGYFEGKVTADTPCNPLSLYGISKNALRQAILTYAENKNVSLKWLRAFYVTGDDEHNKSIFAKILEMNKIGQQTFPFTSGNNKYDFLNIDELAKQIVCASTQNNISGIINVCSGKSIALKDKVEEFIHNHNLNIRPEYGAFPNRKYDSPEIYGDNTLINKIMGK